MTGTPKVDREEVTRLWMHRQGLAAPRGETKLTADSLASLLEATGGLQVDSINVVDRAHLLTLWSRFGSFDRASLDRLLYHDRVAYEYWGHEASILPISFLPLSRRRMRDFPPPRWQANSWWDRYQTSTASRRRVLRRVREDGPLESLDIEPLDDEDKRSLKLLWHGGRVAVSGRRHFRIVYDLAERV
ncbi:MAG: winged helix DNA-binding domain-containing protein, partial [Gemmatimonadota bacterium]|nr:winged helix DNA-binding domain-containing protein [Gemmatimonadota bacterium]